MNDKHQPKKVAKLTLPKVHARKYFSMNLKDLQHLEDLFSGLGKLNKKWIHQNAPSPKTEWMYVSVKGKIWGYGYGPSIPATHQVVEASELVGEKLYLLRRSNLQHCDSSFFIRSSNLEQISQLFGRSKEDFIDYSGINEGVLTIDAQSGLVNKLLNTNFAIGKLKILYTLTPDKDRHYNAGATVADIHNVGWASSEAYEFLHIGSQNKDEVHARGAKVTGERPQDESRKIKRIERLHRFDNPILDIFDTYLQKGRGWHSLVLHGLREKFGLDEKNDSLLYSLDSSPLYEPYRKQ